MLTEGKYQPMGFEQLAVSNAAVALASPKGTLYSPTETSSSTVARCVHISVETGNVRWRDDGTNPTAAIGCRMMKDTSYDYFGDLKAIRFIRESVDAVINVSYYK